MTQIMGTDDFLAHYGVKGMKWGVRKTPERQLRKVNRQLNRGNGHHIFEGHLIRAGHSGKLERKARQKDPNWKYNKLSDDEFAKFNTKAANRARATRVANAAMTTAIIAGAAMYTTRNIASSPQVARGAQLSFAILGAQHVLPQLGDIRKVNAAQRHNRLIRKRDDLRKEVERSELERR